MAMGMNEITNLAHVLFDNGDKILNGSSKLSVNASLLQKIGAELNNIVEENTQQSSSSFEVLSTSHGQSKTMDHLQFLHDFFQKTSGLKLVNSANLLDSNAIIDISKFKKLKYLELQRVPIKQLIGLKVVQHQIECLVCERGLSALEHLLAECGGDKSTGFVWSELKEAVLSFNTIKIVDSSVAFAPRLQVLDLSHNQIFDVNAIERLPNLKYVNLSFNSLTEIPLFNKSAKKRMEVLVLKNNFIENLNPLSGLDSLRELDLSNNMVCCFQNFKPLLSMATLHLLSISGNPVCVIQTYRLSVVKCLHISAAFGNFVLDGSALSKKEKENVGVELMTQIPFNSTIEAQSPSSNFLPEGEVSVPKPRKKSGKMRLAVIPNFDGTYGELPPEVNDISLSVPKTDHLVTKAFIKEARSIHKENWLRADGVKEILGLPPSAFSSTPYDDSCLLSSLKVSESNVVPSPSNVITTTAVIEHRAPVQTTVEEEKKDVSFLSCNEDQTSVYYSFESEGESEKKEMSPDIETIAESDEEMDTESQKQIYLVTRLIKEESQIKREELFLSVSSIEIRERDVTHGRTIGFWSFESLESATKSNDREIHLLFDTIRRDRRERYYEMEKNEATDFLQLCRGKLETNADSQLISFNCVPCYTVFSVHKKAQMAGANLACPACGSKVVLQADDSPCSEDRQIIGGKPTQVDKKHCRSASVGVSSEIKKSASFSSIDSAVSFDEHNISPLKVTLTGPKAEKRSDSDIEIISNPSLSSIEVIDTPSRLQPLEVTLNQEKLVNPTISAFAAGLTESSSSGSITDSICTAYENSSMASSGVSKKSTIDGLTLFEDQSYDDLTKKSMESNDFENLLKDVLIKVSQNIPKTVKRGEDKDIDGVDYSYTKFDELDHRIKLYIYQNLFTDNSEQLIFLIRCQFLHIDGDSSFEACVVSSNKKLYILKVTNKEEGEEASKFLQRVDNLSVNLNSLTKWETLPWNQGFKISTKATEYLIFLRDPTRTLNFLSFIQPLKFVFPTSCAWKKDSDTNTNLQLTQFLMSSADDPTVLSIICFCQCTIHAQHKINDIFNGACLITPSDLFVFDSLKWMFNLTKFNVPVPITFQKLSDLMQVTVNEKQLKFRFLREAEGLQETWSLTFVGQAVLEYAINIISSPWENLFSVPLQVDYEETDTFIK